MTVLKRLVTLATVWSLSLPALGPRLAAQDTQPTGTIVGRVVDEDGTGVAGAQVYIERPALGTQTRANGEYVLPRVPAGTHNLHARLLGYRPEGAVSPWPPTAG